MSLGASALQPGPITPRLGLRAATDDDHELLFAWHSAAFCGHIERLWGWDETWQRRDFARLFEALPPLIVQSDGMACGYIQTQQRADAIHLVNIALRAETRSHGIGGQLMARLQHLADERGDDVTLAVFRTNTRAAVFYARLGFVIERTTETHEHRRWSPTPLRETPQA